MRITHGRYEVTQHYEDGQPDSWQFVHFDYGGPSDKRCGAAPTLDAAIAEIDFIEECLAERNR